MFPKKQGLTKENLTFYFDGEKKKAIDRIGGFDRLAEILKLRSRMMALTEEDFQIVHKTLESLIEHCLNNGKGKAGDNQQSKEKQKAVRHLADLTKKEMYDERQRPRGGDPGESIRPV